MNYESVADRIKRLLRVPLEVIWALMPDGEAAANHYVGGYVQSPGKSWAQAEYERDTEGWTVIGEYPTED